MGCSSCEGFVSDKEFEYSIEKYGKILCRNCQPNYANLKNKHEERKNRSTPEAIKLFEILLKMGFYAELEKWDGYKHIDIAIPDKMINIEVDGKQHQNKKQALADLKRTYHSFKKSYVTLRIPNQLVQEDTVFETANYIKEFLKESEAQLDEDYMGLISK